MGNEPILPVIQPVTINTMLNNNGPNIGDGLNFVTCERSFSVKGHLPVVRNGGAQGQWTETLCR